MRVLDAVVVGAGPSGLGASIALSGWRPHYVPAGTVANPELAKKLEEHLVLTPSGLLTDIQKLGAGLRGRSNNPAALLYDALQHPGADLGWRQPSCLKLRYEPRASTSHIVVDPNPFGGSWHDMHEATLTLSPGPWMELPGYRLADHRTSAEPLSAASAQHVHSRKPRVDIARYYQAAAEHFDVARHHRQTRVSVVRWQSEGNGSCNASADAGNAANAAESHGATGGSATTNHSGAPWLVELADGSPPLRARALVLATGTWAAPRTLGIQGEGAPFVSHRCSELTNSLTVVGTSRTQRVVVVGAGLSAANCAWCGAPTCPGGGRRWEGRRGGL